MIKKNHKPFLVITIIILILTLFIFILINNNDKIIGEVYGAEHEYIKIGNDTYTECNNPGVSISKARDKRLGKVIFKNTEADPMIVWSIEGYDDSEYIYTLGI